MASAEGWVHSVPEESHSKSLPFCPTPLAGAGDLGLEGEVALAGQLWRPSGDPGKRGGLWSRQL